MPRNSTKSIAVALLIALGIIFVAILGLLLNMLAGQLANLPWLNAQPWYTLRNLELAIAAVIVAAIIVALWQHFASKDAGELVSPPTIGEMLLERYEIAVKEGLIAKLDVQKFQAEMARQAEEMRKLQEQLAARSSKPPEAQLAKLLQARNLDGALRLKSKQVEDRRKDAANLPRDLFELGTIHELRFEWPQALAAYREAWELGKNPAHGFKYALYAAKLNHHAEAIQAFEALLCIIKDPSYRAGTLNNLANLYRGTQHMNEAEQAYAEALNINRILAEANPEAYLPSVAMTLNNIAILYKDTQRMKEAEKAYSEALEIRRKLAEVNQDVYLPDVAGTLNNLGLLYRDTQRMKKAEKAYGEALATYRKLAETNPEAYQPDIAMTLNNLAALYYATQRVKEAGQVYGEALDIRRNLAETNPDAFLPDVAITLNNLAALYQHTQHMKEAE